MAVTRLQSIHFKNIPSSNIIAKHLSDKQRSTTSGQAIHNFINFPVTRNIELARM